MIEISNICKSFGNKRVLNNFSLKIEDKCIVGIYGKNGCGKFNFITNFIWVIKAR